MVMQYDYGRLAKFYDTIELGGPLEDDALNKLIDSVLSAHKARNVLDLTAGTGQQSVYLAKRYDVVANDLSSEMLAIAKKKARRYGVKIRFANQDMRTIRAGRFDAAISMFNAIGHLSREGFRKALLNVASNLRPGGIYMFDIFNLSRMAGGGFATYKFIDVATTSGSTKYVRFNRNRLDAKNGIMRISQELWIQEQSSKPSIINERWDLQIYRLSELKALLGETGFELMKVYGGVNRERFDDRKSPIILAVARRT